MSDTVIQIEGLWKEYRLGVIGHGTLTRDLQSWWARVRGKEDPNSKLQPILARQEKQIEGDRFWALRDINLEVKEGEILGIIGRNGAGKSTLLKLLSRVTAPTKGQIKIKGRIASLLEVGTGFHSELTGRENIFMNGAILGMSKQEIKSKLDEIIDFSGVEKFIDTPVKRYSSGMYVRLAFAVAAHLEPEILVIDEVLAVGDAEFQKKCLGKMGEVSKAGRTVLFVSHNMVILKKICEKCSVMAEGRCSFSGNIQEGIQFYQSIIQKNNIDIKEQKNRRGSGIARFVGIEYLNSQRQKVDEISNGEQCIIRLFIKTETKERQEIRVAIGINDSMDTRVLLFDTELLQKKIYIDDNFFSIDFLIEKMSLAEGVYTLTLFLQVGCHISDWVQNSCQLIIKNGDFYKNGKKIDFYKGVFLQDFEVS